MYNHSLQIDRLAHQEASTRRIAFDPCFVYWAFGFKKLPPERLWEWPGYMKMLLQHNRRRDAFVEYSQTSITDVDNCIECMRVCPVGERWKNIRPTNLPMQESFGTGRTRP
jgi:hypothetical protein